MTDRGSTGKGGDQSGILGHQGDATDDGIGVGKESAVEALQRRQWPASQPVQPSGATGAPREGLGPGKESAVEVLQRRQWTSSSPGAHPSSADGQLAHEHEVGALAASMGISLGRRANSAPAASEPSPPSPGAAPQPLPYRADMERAFGLSFGAVEAHTGAAAELEPLGAQALTVGNKVVFADAEPSRALVTHEATHVAQNQRAGAAMAMASGVVAPRDSAAEAEADTNASLVAAHGPGVRLPPIAAAPPAHIHLSPKRLIPDADAPAAKTTILVPDANHPSKRGIDGEQVIQTGTTTDPGTATPLRGTSWKSLAEVTESIQVQDDSGDTLRIDITYRLESRPAELGDVPDIWIHTERKALLTIGSGEHAGATIVGQARIQLAPEDARDPKTAIAKTSIGADHWAQVYLAEAKQYVNLHGAGGRASLLADAAGNDVLAYDDPLRTLVGLKNILKQQRVAGHGRDVAKMHAQAQRLLADAKRGRIVLEREIASVASYHDPHPGRVAPIRFLVSDIESWLAANQQTGRDATEDARQLRHARDELERLLAGADSAHAPKRNQAVDAADATMRFVERTVKGLGEVGAMAVDAVALGVDAIGEATGIGTFEYHPLSNYGQAVDDTGANVTTALVTMVNGFADQWSDAIERANHGDYRSMTDVGIDTLMMIDGARTGGVIAIEKGEALAAKLGNVAKSARALASGLPAGAAEIAAVARGLPTEARDIAAAMADGADAFVARLRAGGMQMATGGGGGGPGPNLGGLSAETLVDAAQAAKEAFKDKRVAQEAAKQGDHAAARPDSSTSSPTDRAAAPEPTVVTTRGAVARQQLAAKFGESTADKLASVIGDQKLPNIAAKADNLALKFDEGGATGSYRWGGTGNVEGATSGGGVRTNKINDPHTGLRTVEIEGPNGEKIKLSERDRYADVRIDPAALPSRESEALQKLLADHGIIEEAAKRKVYEAIENARIRDPSFDVGNAIRRDVLPTLKEADAAAKKQSAAGRPTTTQDVLAAQGNVPLAPEAQGPMVAQAQALVAAGILEDPAFRSARTLAEGRDALSQKALRETGRQRAEAGGSKGGKVLTKIQFIGDLYVDDTSAIRYRSKSTGKEIMKTDVVPDIDVAYVTDDGSKINVEYIGGAKIGKPSASAKALGDAKIQNARSKEAIEAGSRRFKTTTRDGDTVWAEVKSVSAVEGNGGEIDLTGKLAMDPAAKLETIGAPGMTGFDATMQVSDAKTLNKVVEALWRIAELRTR